MNNQGNEQIKNQLILTSSEKIVLDNYKQALLNLI